jgi:homoserine dehydrogenase
LPRPAIPEALLSQPAFAVETVDKTYSDVAVLFVLGALVGAAVGQRSTGSRALGSAVAKADTDSAVHASSVASFASPSRLQKQAAVRRTGAIDMNIFDSMFGEGGETKVAAGPVRIGMLGAGVVGGGVVEVLKSNPQVKFVRVCVRDESKQRDFELPDGCSITTNPDDLLKDDIDCVVEVAGGTGLANDLMLKAMAAGKSVVTANKAAISANLDELSAASTAKKAPFLFEAAVCGGIPIINTMRSGLQGDRAERIAGIMNGTTNYILTRMAGEGVAYSDVLVDAQRLGYAEADPAADVEGWDARSKLCILSKMGFGLTLDEEAMWCQGITKLRKDDFDYMKYMNCTIKILGVASVAEAGKGPVNAYVSPHAVKGDSTIAATSGATNLVTVKSTNIGDSTYVGAGAGRWPTAQSVVADILRVKSPWSPAFGTRDVEAGGFERDFLASWYIRVNLRDEIGALARVMDIMRDAKISIYSVLQTPITDRSNVCAAIITDDCRLSQVETVAKLLANDTEGGASPVLLEEPFYMPFYSESSD